MFSRISSPPGTVLAPLTLTATVSGGLLLLAGLTGALPPAVAAGGAATLAVTAPAATLLTRAIRTRVAARSTPMLRGACRCEGLLGLGLAASGVTASVLAFAEPPLRSMLATCGLVLAAALSVSGLLHLPGVADRPPGRLRQALDGLVIGASMAVAGWLLPTAGHAHPLAYVTAAVVATTAAVLTVIMMRASRPRTVPVLVGTGTGAVVAGLALLSVLVEGAAAPGWALLAAAAPAVVGPALVSHGTRRINRTGSSAGAGCPTEHVNDYPAVALPVGVVVLAYTFHLLVTGPHGHHGAVVVGMALGALLAARELLTATDLRRCTRALVSQQAHLRALVAGAGDVTMVVDEDLRVRWMSPAGGQQFGLTGSQVVDRRFTDLVHPDDAAAVCDRLRAVLTGRPATADGGMVEARLRDGRGGWRETESTVSDLRDVPAVGALVMQVRDVGQRRSLERTLQRLTSTDQLTGLANRRELVRAVEARRGAGYRSGALLVVDLAGVGVVNDLRGRPVGDALLVAAARRVRALVGPEDVVARLEERQFAVVTPVEPIEAYALGFRLLSGLGEPFPSPDRPVALLPSVGLASLTGDADVDEVIRRGDLALRRASQLDHPRLDWYDEGLEQRLVRRLDLERHLPGATGRGEFSLVYQLVMDLVDDRPVGVEALLRWHHPVLGTVLPGELLPVAERLRLTGEIGEWVLHTAARQVAEWRQTGFDLWLSVNVSASALVVADFVPEVAVALSVHQTPPERLVVEVAEAEVEGDASDVANQLSRLRALGVRTALDDFGTGRTDLARSRRLPLDLVKLSPLTFADTGDSAAAVMELTRRLGVAPVAKGLETGRQRTAAQQAGCRYGQGRLLAAPAPAERVEAYLERHRVRGR